MENQNSNKLGKKRLDAALAIATYAVGSGTASAAPTPGGELPRQLLLTASDILMYTRIWKTYFEEDLSEKNVVEILTELGLVSIVGAGAAYIAGKATTAALKELTNLLGPLGWGFTAAIAGSFSALFGAMWTLYCDNLYLQQNP
ncbi:hypothetical protein [Calothrix sp. NIES-3974]|uniref:hypothetical protein n=1 Tax=Calothrix sp. NIES-3974 TaxID=2005462 RepID=UPI000B60E4FC|nr:hypothetical protein [Calothrix sp. NIES-3974]BAZ06920.1 hypothetical protein NIES3974_35820 [Calothrix sp. NIES-3974]